MTEGWRLRTPVVFLIFNRPDTTTRVFEAIRRARPPRLLIVADGPRPGKPGEADRCERARAAASRVDWDCEVLTQYSDSNLGCFRRVSSGLDWAFGLCEEAIVLEDDCLPHPDFFRFCEETLERYREDGRIMAIAGTNFQFGRRRTPHSYYFSRYNHCWGWASWRRAWRHFDPAMSVWPEMRERDVLMDILGNRRAVRYWSVIFDAVAAGRIDSWAYRWTFAAWREGALTILPAANLISNIGFSAEATHTKGEGRYADMEVQAVGFPLSHPPYLVRDNAADAYTQATMFASPGPLQRALRRLSRWVGTGR